MKRGSAYREKHAALNGGQLFFNRKGRKRRRNEVFIDGVVKRGGFGSYVAPVRIHPYLPPSIFKPGRQKRDRGTTVTELNHSEFAELKSLWVDQDNGVDISGKYPELLLLYRRELPPPTGADSLGPAEEGQAQGDVRVEKKATCRGAAR